MKRTARFLVPALASLVLLTGLTGCAKLKARDQMNKGVEAFKSGRYDEAISHFQKATQLDPQFEMARTALATSYAMSVVPGSDSADNKRNADLAIASYQGVLNKDPKDINATKGIASIYFNTNQFDLAKQWQKKVLDIDPNDPEANYTIGVIDWGVSRRNSLKVLEGMGSTDKADGNPQLPKKDCQQLAAINTPINDEALAYLNKAVQIRPSYDDAMAYLNLVYRRKAETECGNDAARKADLAEAQVWTQRTMDTRKANEQKALQAAPGGVKMDQ
jgi:tetratricopeptide (TPR) repeat protein